jgi:hypothetical protein
MSRILQIPQQHAEQPADKVQRIAFETAQQRSIALFAVGMMALGALALIYGDFALVWQPVAPWFPARTALAYGSGVLMLLAGAGWALENSR